MRLLRIALMTLGMLTWYASLPAQTVTVTGSKIQNSAGTKLSGVITWHPVLSTGQPAIYIAPNGGVTVSTPIVATVTAGAFTLHLSDTSLTNPPDVCFWVTFSNQKGDNFGDGKGLRCVQPHGTAVDPTDWCQAGVCNFDNYVPAPDSPTQATYGPPDMSTMWNSIVATWLATPGNSVNQIVLTDAPTITLNLSSANLSAGVLKFYTGTAPDGITARTVNVTRLVTGARFLLVIDPIDLSPANTPQTVTFGDGCAWSFGPGVAVVNNVLTIPSYEGTSYLAYFAYDGTNCIGMVAH